MECLHCGFTTAIDVFPHYRAYVALPHYCVVMPSWLVTGWVCAQVVTLRRTQLEWKHIFCFE